MMGYVGPSMRAAGVPLVRDVTDEEIRQAQLQNAWNRFSQVYDVAASDPTGYIGQQWRQYQPGTGTRTSIEDAILGTLESARRGDLRVPRWNMPPAGMPAGAGAPAGSANLMQDGRRYAWDEKMPDGTSFRDIPGGMGPDPGVPVQLGTAAGQATVADVVRDRLMAAEKQRNQRLQASYAAGRAARAQDPPMAVNAAGEVYPTAGNYGAYRKAAMQLGLPDGFTTSQMQQVAGRQAQEQAAAAELEHQRKLEVERAKNPTAAGKDYQAGLVGDWNDYNNQAKKDAGYYARLRAAAQQPPAPDGTVMFYGRPTPVEQVQAEMAQLEDFYGGPPQQVSYEDYTVMRREQGDPRVPAPPPATPEEARQAGQAAQDAWDGAMGALQDVIGQLSRGSGLRGRGQAQQAPAAPPSGNRGSRLKSPTPVPSPTGMPSPQPSARPSASPSAMPSPSPSPSAAPAPAPRQAMGALPPEVRQQLLSLQQSDELTKSVAVQRIRSSSMTEQQKREAILIVRGGY